MIQRKRKTKNAKCKANVQSKQTIPESGFHKKTLILQTQ